MFDVLYLMFLTLLAHDLYDSIMKITLRMCNDRYQGYYYYFKLTINLLLKVIIKNLMSFIFKSE